MSSKKYAAPLRLRPGTPWRLFALICAAALGTLLLLTAAPLPLPVTAAAGLWLALWAALAGWFHLGPGRIVEAIWKEQGEWVLRQRCGRELTAHLAPDTFFRPWLVVLNFRAERRIPALVLFPGEPDEQTHRRLRVRLRLFQAGGYSREESGEGLISRLRRLFGGRSSWQE
jgi:hypothetical protein